jgi:antitoxin component HigA of HigAB toxin-antitoxin module
MEAAQPWPADVIRYLMNQHELTRADMVPILGGASRVSEVLSGRNRFVVTATVCRPDATAHSPQAAWPRTQR